jgi:GT2 family glycosyltransferase
VGAVAIPYADVKKSPKTRHRAPDSDAVYCTAAFKGTAYALRRSLFLDLGGYREHFFHQGEESDYCVRMLDAGYVVRLGRADRINHYESPKRDFVRMDYYGRRNEVLFAYHNVPGLLLPKYLLGAAVNTVRTAIRYGRVRHFLQGLLAGYRDCIRFGDRRTPVRPRTMRLFRRLRDTDALRLCSVLQQMERE